MMHLAMVPKTNKASCLDRALLISKEQMGERTVLREDNRYFSSSVLICLIH